MSLFYDFISVIVSGLFNLSNETENKKIIPKMEMEMEMEDIELGNVRREIKEIYKTDNYLNSMIQNPDLELGFGPIVEINCGKCV